MAAVAAQPTSTDSSVGATSVQDCGSAADKVIKCRKCRGKLAESPPCELTIDDDSSEDGDHNVIAIADNDTLPEWITNLIEEAGWTKGKLLCPGCGSRVGGFDYVGGHKTPVHIVKSKVDVQSPNVNLVQGTVMQRIQPIQESDTSSGSDRDLSEDETSMSRDGSGVDHGGTSSSNHTDHESSEEDERTTQLRSKRLKEKMRRKRRHKEQTEEQREKELLEKAHNAKLQAKMEEILAPNHDLDQLSDDIICPVCLDLLHEPYQTDPCGHIFCEPCLRRLGQKNPMNTKCPLCRTRIGFCKHLAATSREIREDYESLYLKRKKMEKETPVHSYALPWTPGWRNLIRGRPLGGNRLLIRNHQGGLARTVLHHIPYYVPPIIFCNIINLMLMGFILGFLELLPTILMVVFTGSKDGGVGVNLTAADPAVGQELVGQEMSGASPVGQELSGDDSGESEGSGSIQEALEASGIGGPHVIMDTFEPTAMDSFYIVVVISLIGIMLGQILLNNHAAQEMERNAARLPEVVMMVCLMLLTIVVLPTFLPQRASESTLMSSLFKKSLSSVVSQFSIPAFLMIVIVISAYFIIDGHDNIIG